MDNNDYGQNYTYDRGTYYSMPRWNDFTLDDERQAKRRFSRFFFGVFFFLLISNVVAVAVDIGMFFIFGEEKYIDLTNQSWYALTLNVLCQYVIAFPIFYLIINGMPKTVRAKRGMKFSELVKLFVIAQAFMYVGNLVGTYLNLIIGSFIGKMPTNAISDLVYSSNVWILIAVAVIIGPIVEELIFRKLLMDRLGIYGDRVAIFVSAISFGIFHCNLYQFFYAMLLGLILAYMYSKTANVWYPIGLHMLLNFFGSVIPLLLAEGIAKLELLSTLNTTEATNEEILALASDPAVFFASLYMILDLVILVAGVVLFFKNRRRIFVSDRCEVCIPKEKRGSVIVGNAGVIAFLTITGLLMIVNILFS